MKPIYKFNNGRGATLCHLCRTIITTGKMTNDLYCDRCFNERVKIEEEFNAIHKAKRLEALKANFTMQEYNEQNKYLVDERGQWIKPGEDEAWKKFLEQSEIAQLFYDQMDKEVHFNRGDLNK